MCADNMICSHQLHINVEQLILRFCEGEENDPRWVEVQVGGVVDQTPDVRDEELLRSFLLDILELQLGALLE